MKHVTVPIKGMHCHSCEITLTSELEKLPGVSKAEVSLRTHSATITASRLPGMTEISKVIKNAGYDIGHEQKRWVSMSKPVYKDLMFGVALVTIIALVVSKAGLGNVNTGSLVSGGIFVALLVGLTAGFSTCMAIVGGLVLGLSAKHAEKHPDATAIQKFRPHLYFNFSRVIAFFVLGGAIGALGAVFQLQGPPLGILTVVVGLVMLILGLQLTEVFPRLSNGGLTLPAGIARLLGVNRRHNQEYSHKNATILGAASFFLPCGFTQAMQLYAISTGSFKTGALVMGLFAIGTMPGLLGVAGLTSVVEGNTAKRFFRIAGVAVVAMALLNISNGYNLTGWPKPFNRVSQTTETGSPEIIPTSPTGDVNTSTPAPAIKNAGNKLKASYTLASGMIPSTFTVKANESYVLEVNALEDGVGCMSTILIPGLNNDVQYILKGKVNRLPFKAKRPGSYLITCAMGVPHGKLIVI